MPYQEPDGTWRGVVKIGTKRAAQKRGFSTQRKAVKWEVEEKKKILKEREQKSLDLSSLTIKYMEFVKRYSKGTYKEKLSLSNRILARWGAYTLVQDITPMMGLDYLKDRMMEEITQEEERKAKGIEEASDKKKKKKKPPRKKPNAANRDRKNLVAMWNWGKVFMGVNTNPFVKVPKFPHDRATQYIPTRADVLKLKAVCKPEEYAYIGTMLQTGGRRSEINRLRVDDIDFTHGQIRLKNRKSKDGSLQPRWVDMSDELIALLKRWLKIRPIKDAVWLFYVTDTRSCHYGNAFTTRRRFLRGLCKRAGIKEMGYHALRRHVASYLADNLTPLKVIQNVLGHASLSTTEKYIGRIRSDDRNYMNLLSLESIPHDAGETERKSHG